MLFALTLALAADPCLSGIPIGGRPGPYSFLVATGPERGKPTCYICEQEKKPAAVVFFRTRTDAVGKLLAKLDAEMTARKDSGFKAWATQLTDTAELDALAKWGGTHGLKAVALGAFEDADGPPAYKLARDAEVTVLLFTDRKVVANFAYRAAELTPEATADVLAAMPKLFPAKDWK